MLAGAAVALVGNMAFIGLMVPHLVRAIVGTDYRYIIPMSAIAGAIFMLLADTIGRTINAPYETPVAAIVAMMGLPFFLLIVRKGGKAFLMIQPTLLRKQRIIYHTCITGAYYYNHCNWDGDWATASLSYDRLLPTLFGQGTFKEEFILFSVRLPRIIITIISRYGSALSGAILQGVTRNDLADPGIIGINAGAGVAIAVFFLFFPIESRLICLFTSARRICRCVSNSCSNLPIFI